MNSGHCECSQNISIKAAQNLIGYINTEVVPICFTFFDFSNDPVNVSDCSINTLPVTLNADVQLLGPILQVTNFLSFPPLLDGKINQLFCLDELAITYQRRLTTLSEELTACRLSVIYVNPHFVHSSVIF